MKYRCWESVADVGSAVPGATVPGSAISDATVPGSAPAVVQTSRPRSLRGRVPIHGEAFSTEVSE